MFGIIKKKTLIAPSLVLFQLLAVRPKADWQAPFRPRSGQQKKKTAELYYFQKRPKNRKKTQWVAMVKSKQ